MDNLGAAIGPALATLILLLAPENYRLVFLLAAVPALVSVIVFMRSVPRVALPRVEAVRHPLADAHGLLRGQFGGYLIQVAFLTGAGLAITAVLLLSALSVLPNAPRHP